MLKKDNVFHWEEQQTQSFQKIKYLIAKANKTLLRYYDQTLPVTVKADASLRGLGACLIQQHNGKDQPIAGHGRSYDTQVEATGGHLRKNCSHIRPKSPDIPMMHASFLQQNSVSSATSDMNTLSTRENLVT